MATRAPKLTDALVVQGVLPLKSENYLLIDFFTFGCINCMNVLADLNALVTDFADRLEVVSIHTPKFKREEDLETLKKALKFLGVHHTVIQDINAYFWDRFAVKAWPTWVLVDPKGYIVYHESGEGHYEKIVSFLEGQVKVKTLDRVKETCFTSIAVEGALCAIATQNSVELFKARRLLFRHTTFQSVSDLKFDGNRLYICDQEANSVFELDLNTLTMRILIEDVRNPYSIEFDEEKFYVALAGSHQIISLDKKSKAVQVLAGNRFEGLRDGCEDVMLAQPVALAKDDYTLWFIDAESSSLRSLEEGCVKTYVGEDCVTFGDSDTAPMLLQHPQALCLGKIEDGCGAGRLFIADTYNDKIKVFDPQSRTIMTLTKSIGSPHSIMKKGCSLFITSMSSTSIFRFDVHEMALYEYSKDEFLSFLGEVYETVS